MFCARSNYYSPRSNRWQKAATSRSYFGGNADSSSSSRCQNQPTYGFPQHGPKRDNHCDRRWFHSYPSSNFYRTASPQVVFVPVHPDNMTLCRHHDVITPWRPSRSPVAHFLHEFTHGDYGILGAYRKWWMLLFSFVIVRKLLS